MEKFEDFREEWWFSCCRAGGQNNSNSLTQVSNKNLKKKFTLPTKLPLQTLETIATLVNYNRYSFHYV